MKKTAMPVIVATLIVLVLCASLAGGCVSKVKPSPSKTAEAKQLRSQLTAMKAKYKDLKTKYDELKTLVPPAVEAKPITIDAGKTALIIVDMQNDFLKLGGKLGPSKAAKAKHNAKIISYVKALLDRCRNAGIPVIYTEDYHHPDDPEFAIWGPHCVVGTSGQKVVSELSPKPGDHIVRKGGKTISYDAFYASYKPNEMEDTLKRLGVDTVIVTGAVSNICVYADVVGCAQRGYETVVPRDCIVSLSPAGERLALYQFSALYRVAVTQSDMLKIVE